MTLKVSRTYHIEAEDAENRLTISSGDGETVCVYVRPKSYHYGSYGASVTLKLDELAQAVFKLQGMTTLDEVKP